MEIQANFLLIQHLTHPRGQDRMGNIIKKTFLYLLLTALLIIGIFKMTSTNEQKISKLTDEVNTGYHLFSETDKRTKTLSTLDKSELLQFITINMNALSEKGKIEQLDKISHNFTLELHTPKLPFVPFQRGYITYTYIIKNKSNTSDGVYGQFNSEVNRKDNDSPWSYSNIDVDTNILLSTNFLHEDYEKLGLKFKREFPMSDLERNAIKPDLRPDRNHKNFIDTNKGIFAFYEFSALQNSVPLTLVFGVPKNGYKEKEEFPRNWAVLYIKRNDAPEFSMPGE